MTEADPGGHPNPVFFDGHGMQPDVVFGMLGLLGGQAGRIVVVGCEPDRVDYGMELSEPVAAAVDEAVRVVLDMVADLTQAADLTKVADLPRDTVEGVADVPWHTG